jgi:hypothetical protein
MAAHVIPNPDDDLDLIMGGKYLMQGPITSPDRPIPTRPQRPVPESKSSAAVGGGQPSLDDIENLPVAQLRQFARNIPNLAIKGREISRADRDTLLREIRNALKLQG